MTDTPTPAVMVSRQRTGSAVAVTASADDTRLSVELRYAEAIARAGNDMLPESYRNKPGAVLLVNQWAQQHQVDIVTAMQSVAFIKGRPVIDATMQRALAERAGYRVKVLDESDDRHAIVEVWKDGERLGSADYTIEQATTARLTTKDVWKQHPSDMLVARATSRAIRRHAPGVLIGLAVGDEIDHADPVATLVAEHGTEPEPEVAPESDIVDAELVDDPELGPENEPEPITVDTLKVRLRSLNLSQGDAIAKAREVAAENGIATPNAIAAIVENETLMAAVVAWLDEL